MRFLADENISPLIVQALRNAGHDVLEVRETCPGCNDETVLKIAREQGRILLTGDADFGALTMLRRLSIPGVIHLRLHGFPIDRRADTLLRVTRMGLQFQGFLTVVEAQRVRQRRLPGRDVSR